MSRGLGRVERAVLAYLEQAQQRSPGWETRLDVVAGAIDCHPESVRRAFKSLERKGIVALGWDNGWRDDGGDGYRFWETSVPTARLSVEYLSTLTETP